MKKYLSLFIILFIVHCGKKLPPPSPDVFAPKLKSIVYSQNNQIQCLFNENIFTTIDSIKINDSISLKDYYTSGNVLYIQYNNYDISHLSLYGVADKNKNKRNFVNIKIEGEKIIDTIEPFIKNIAYFDTLITINFSEFIQDCDIEIFPNYIHYEKDIIKNRCLIHLVDTINLYAIELIFHNAIDNQGNILNKRQIKYFINDYDSSYIYSIKLNSIKTDSMFIYTSDTILLYKEYIVNNILIFSHLMAGEYLIGNIRDSLIPFYSKNNN